MFNKVYPKSCTMVDDSFERSYKTASFKKKKFVGSGTWSSRYLSGIFYNNAADFNTREGFRGGIYVQ